MKYFVGAYASSPNVSGWDAALESRYYDQLNQFSNLEGLEHPFVGSLHPHDDDWFLKHINPEWDFVFTCVPGIMAAKSKNPLFGIASDDKGGREQAIAFLESARHAIEKLNTHLGRQAVRGIQIQTSPSRSVASSSVSSLKQSLETICEWDWQGARIIIEHCDAFVEGQVPAKGFLTIEEEIEAIEYVNAKCQTNIGININWGRSVIETRSCDGAINHIAAAREKNLMCGMMFSGVSNLDTEYGEWRDTHMPPEKYKPDAAGAVGSLMTEDEMFKSLGSCDIEALDFIGVKLGVRPAETALEERVAYNRDALAILDRFFQK